MFHFLLKKDGFPANETVPKEAAPEIPIEYHIFRGKEMDFYSSVSGILVVHISDYSGKLCLSAGLEREFTMFWTNHRAYSDHMYYLWHYGYVLLCNILLFPQPKNGIFCKYIFLAD